jgi:hypothetical protein
VSLKKSSDNESKPNNGFITFRTPFSKEQPTTIPAVKEIKAIDLS